MRFPLKLSALLAMLLLGLTLLGGTGVGAQGSPEASFDPAELDGFRIGAMRFYTMDYSAMMEQMSTPGAEMEMPAGLAALGAAVFEFEEEDQAKDAFTKLQEESGLQEEFMTEDAEEVESDLGDQAVMYNGSEEVEGMSLDSTLALVQDGNYVYFVYATGSEVDVETTVNDFASRLIEADGSGEGEFNEDGTSTGGVWDKFPAADDELIQGLIPSDQQLLPGQDEE